MTWWQAVLHWLGVTVYVGALGVAVVGAFLGLPGTPVLLAAGLIYSAVHEWAQPPLWLVLGLIPVAVAVELVDNLTSMAAVRRYGGSAAAMWWVVLGALGGALALGWLAPVTGLVGLVGGVAGVVVGAVVPPLLGGLLGGFLGGYWYERREGRSPEEARRAGWGALVGRLAGGLIRGLLTLGMAVILIVFSFE